MKRRSALKSFFGAFGAAAVVAVPEVKAATVAAPSETEDPNYGWDLPDEARESILMTAEVGTGTIAKLAAAERNLAEKRYGKPSDISQETWDSLSVGMKRTLGIRKKA